MKQIVLHVQEIWSPREAAVLGLFARGANRIFCISTAARDALPAKLQNRAEILFNAHSDSEVRLVPVPPEGEQLRFVVASRWNAWKGHSTLLRAWDEEVCPGDLVILGGPPTMGTGIDVPGLVSGLRHREHISVVGEVDDIASYIDAADFLILPSDKPEPFGLVLLEAFARGRAVIASEAGGVLDVVTRGTDGWLFPVGSASGLASVLNSLDRGMAQEMGRNARRSYEENFSIEAYRGRFRQLWHKMKIEDSGEAYAQS
ncbi:glycosyltransferase family 4 protein [Arthrobacter sp. U41]|uniref:glycosyltransferase family 4 protein n=1 Tax=Arthrobacter sp. U41 TaxID=1849032 RepID=UPI0018D34C8C|nr:glycosyltransferase family 4 protein [Arthrobacter sp. U41]